MQMNKFTKGDRVVSDNGHFGTVAETYWDEFNEPHGRVDVKWDTSGKSYRPEDGLTKVETPKLNLTPGEVIAAKATLGPMWGLNRPLHNSELARALRLTGRDPGRSVEAWSKGPADGGTPISGPATVAIKMMLAGALPPDPMSVIVRK